MERGDPVHRSDDASPSKYLVYRRAKHGLVPSFAGRDTGCDLRRRTSLGPPSGDSTPDGTRQRTACSWVHRPAPSGAVLGLASATRGRRGPAGTEARTASAVASRASTSSMNGTFVPGVRGGRRVGRYDDGDRDDSSRSKGVLTSFGSDGHPISPPRKRRARSCTGPPSPVHVILADGTTWTGRAASHVRLHDGGRAGGEANRAGESGSFASPT